MHCSCIALHRAQALVDKSALRFSRDLRLAEVRRLLCSSRAMALRLGNGGPELTDHELIHEQQSRLLLLCRRSLTLILTLTLTRTLTLTLTLTLT